MRRDMRKIMSLVMILGLVLTTVAVSAPKVVTAGPSFKDLDKHWAGGYINNWANQKLVGGYEDNTFRPDNPITKAEFIVLVNRVMGYNDVTEISFPDVPASAWYRGDVVKSQAIGYSHAYKDGTFGPNKPLSREEAAVMIYRIMKLENVEVEDVLASFSDAKKIDPDYREALNAVVNAGYLGGYPDKTVRPKQTTTRAEMIIILDRIAGAKYRTAGTFGPEAEQETVKTNVTVSQPGITLQNMIIEGDLHLTEGIGDGDCYLNNITVKGRTLIAGGGSSSIHVSGSSNLGQLEVNSATRERIRIVIDTDNIATHGLFLRSGATIVGSLSIVGNPDGSAPQVQLADTSEISQLIIDATANGSQLTLAGLIEFLQVQGADVEVNITGGRIDQVNLDAPTTVGMTGGTIGQLNVGQGASGSNIAVGDDADIEDTELGEGTSIIVNDEEVKDKPSTPTPPSGGDTGGSGPYVPPTVRVTGVTVSPAAMTLLVGETETITPSVTPANATNRSITWTSSNTSVATVAGGVVTAKKAGTATITATTADGGKTANCEVIVNQVIHSSSVEAPDSSRVGFDVKVQLNGGTQKIEVMAKPKTLTAAGGQPLELIKLNIVDGYRDSSHPSFKYACKDLRDGVSQSVGNVDIEDGWYIVRVDEADYDADEIGIIIALETYGPGAYNPTIYKAGGVATDYPVDWNSYRSFVRIMKDGSDPQPLPDVILGESIQAAIDAATGDTITLMSGTYNIADTITVSKPVTIKGASNHGTELVTSGTNPVFTISAAATLDGIFIRKADKVGEHHLVTVTANGVTIKNSKFLGTYAQGDSEVTRAIVPNAGVTGYTIIDNHFESLRQPAYLEGAGTVTRNFVKNTRGWVVCANHDVTFNGNTFEANAVDIAILANGYTSSEYYNDVVAISTENNGAHVENQLTGKSAIDGKLVIANTEALLAAIQEADDRATLELAPGIFTITNTLHTAKPLTIKGYGMGRTILDVTSVPTNAWGVLINKSATTLCDLTIRSAKSEGYNNNLKVSDESNTPVGSLSGIVIRNVAIQGGKGLDIHKAAVELDYVTVSDSKGASIAVSNGANVTISNTTTSNGAWGSLGVMYKDQYAKSTVTLTDGNVFNEGALYSEGYSKLGGEQIIGLDTTNWISYVNNERDQLVWVKQLPQGAYNTIEGVTMGYNTIQAAINAATSGDTILVSAGTYDGFKVSIDNLTINAIGTVNVTPVHFSGSVPGLVGILIDGASNIVIDGFHITGDGTNDSNGLAGFGQVKVSISNSIFTNLHRGIYANSVTPNENIRVSLTSLNNEFASQVGIGGTENTTLIARGNTFKTSVEGIGLGGGVDVIGPTVESDILYLKSNNTFDDATENKVVDYRPGEIDTTSANPARLARITGGYSVVVPLAVGDYQGAKVVISLFDENGELMQANTMAKDDGLTNSTSTTFDTTGEFDYVTDGYWTVEGSMVGKTEDPAKAVIEITLANGKELTHTINTFWGE